MPEQNGEILGNTTNVSTSEGKKTFSWGAIFVLLFRILIPILGLATIILALIGGPSDLDSVGNDNPSQAQPSEFYGYGLGYIPAEPLNAIFVALLIIAWVMTVGLLILTFVSKSSTTSSKLSRTLYLIAGLVACIAVICGSVGTYFFWGGCCKVSFPRRDQNYLWYYDRRELGYTDWCECWLKVAKSGGRQDKYVPTFVWDFPKNTNNEIISAWPHHFVVHIISVVFTSLFGVLCFIAICFV